MESVRIYLASINPALPYLAISLAVGAIVYAWRRVSPASFERLPRGVQSLPAVLLGAVTAAASSGGDARAALWQALLGACAGLAAIGGHHAAKASALPYGRKPPTEIK